MTSKDRQKKNRKGEYEYKVSNYYCNLIFEVLFWKILLHYFRFNLRSSKQLNSNKHEWPYPKLLFHVDILIGKIYMQANNKKRQELHLKREYTTWVF